MNVQQAACPVCETLPELNDEAGTVHLRFPLTHTLGKVLASAKAAGLTYVEAAGLFSVSSGAGALAATLDPIVKALTAPERRDVRCIFQPEGAQFAMADYLGAGSLEALYGKSRSGWLLRMIDEDRLTTFFQPIVDARTQRVAAYECLLRGTEAGRIVYPGQILEVARSAELMFQVDLAARRTAIREAARFGIEGKIFINFTPTSIYDPAFCLRTTMQAADRAGLRHEQIVFEVIESENVTDPSHLRRILDFYRAEGFGVALDDLGSGYSSLNLLNDLRPNYVKLDMGLVRGVDTDGYKGLIAGKLLEVAQALDIITVAEGVETEAEFDWFLAHGVDLVQGYYFAKPASPPPMLDRQ